MTESHWLAALIGWFCGALTMWLSIFGPRRKKREPTAEQIRIAGEPHTVTWKVHEPGLRRKLFRNRIQADDYAAQVRGACKPLDLCLQYVQIEPLKFNGEDHQ